MAKNDVWKGLKFPSSLPSPVPVAKQAAGLAAEYAWCRAWLCREVVGVCWGAAVLQPGAASIASLLPWQEPGAKGPVLWIGTHEESELSRREVTVPVTERGSDAHREMLCAQQPRSVHRGGTNSALGFPALPLGS